MNNNITPWFANMASRWITRIALLAALAIALAFPAASQAEASIGAEQASVRHSLSCENTWEVEPNANWGSGPSAASVKSCDGCEDTGSVDESNANWGSGPQSIGGNLCPESANWGS